MSTIKSVTKEKKLLSFNMYQNYNRHKILAADPGWKNDVWNEIHHTIHLINKELGAHYYVHLCPFYALVGEIFKDSGMDRTRTCQEGYGATPGRSNLNKLHIFEPVSQCSLPYDGVQS